MNGILLQIKTLYEEMGRAEKKIAGWILAHPDEIIKLSISELAEKCGCGEATIVRFSRRLNLCGYQELKISIAQETADGFKPLGGEMSEDDSCYEIFEKICHNIYTSLALTQKALNPMDLTAAAEHIAHARHIAIFGSGNSAAVAVDAQHKFLRTGFYAAAYSDNHMQAIAASHLKAEDMAIGISHSGSSIDVVESLRLSKKAGAFTLGVTNAGNSPIHKHCDIVLHTDSDETRYSTLGASSRIAQLAIIDTIHAYLLLRHSAETIEAVQNTERALLSKKY